MNEEKKLDEETLENVTGGSYDIPIRPDYSTFLKMNCSYCGHKAGGTCPYGSPNLGFLKVGSDGRCRMKADL